MVTGRLAAALGVVSMMAMPPVAGPARGQDPFPIDVSWFVSPPLNDCLGPCDEFGACWQELDFDMSLWEPAFLPYGEDVTGFSDRFFRGSFVVDAADGAVFTFSSDDGIEIFVNGELAGSFGRGCHAPGCVNLSNCGIQDQVPPLDLSGLISPGENLIAVHVTNCDCCCRMEYAGEVSAGGGGPQGPSFRRGDTNQDGLLDLTDGVSTLGCLFLGQGCSACLDGEDANDDGTLDLGDPIFTIDHLFLGGPPPPPPLEDCGGDPTEDFIPCDSYAPCA